MTSLLHIYEFVHLELSLYAKDESVLVTAHDPLNVLLNLVSLNFFWNFLHLVFEVYWP